MSEFPILDNENINTAIRFLAKGRGRGGLAWVQLVSNVVQYFGRYIRIKEVEHQLKWGIIGYKTGIGEQVTKYCIHTGMMLKEAS